MEMPNRKMVICIWSSDKSGLEMPPELSLASDTRVNTYWTSSLVWLKIVTNIVNSMSNPKYA